MFGPTISDEELALIASHYIRLHHVYSWWLWWLLCVHHPCCELNLLTKECTTYTFTPSLCHQFLAPSHWVFQFSLLSVSCSMCTWWRGV